MEARDAGIAVLAVGRDVGADRDAFAEEPARARRVDDHRPCLRHPRAVLLTREAPRFRRLVADKGYHATRFRVALRDAGATPIIPGLSNRKRRIRRVAARYDKLAANFLSTAALAAVVAFWL